MKGYVTEYSDRQAMPVTLEDAIAHLRKIGVIPPCNRKRMWLAIQAAYRQ